MAGQNSTGGDPKLVQSVLDEEHTAVGDELFDGRSEYIGRFGYSTEPSTPLGEERARQSALGKRALQALARCVARDPHHDAVWIEQKDNAEILAIISELRGGK